MAKPSAAIFDLDRTLLRGSSAPVYQRHLAARALGREGGPLGRVYGRIYEALGESAMLMQAARLGARMARQWPVDLVAEAAEAAADELAPQLLPWARLQVEAHRAAGDRLVLATTSPHPWIAPLARRWGFDHLLATRWAAADGAYTGNLDGPFLWGRAKADAVRAWAADEGINLATSSAYSDSHFDTPLFLLVGRPNPVNPDPRLRGLALLQGWPVRHFDVPAGVVKLAGVELQRILSPLARPALIPNVQFAFSGTEHIPTTGGAIIVANHRSYFDPAVLGLLIAMSGRTARYLGKREVFDTPVLGWLAEAFGGIRVDRGTGSTEPLDKAAETLQAGELVAIMPQGTIPRGEAFFDPELKGRWGAAKLATATRVPVIPVGLWGTEAIWPRSARLPTALLPTGFFSPTGSFSRRPSIEVRVGPPVALKYRSADADTKRIMAAISALLPPESQIRIEPTPAQLARTYPPGHHAPGAGKESIA